MTLMKQEFYEEKYGGNLVDDNSFDRMYRRAEAALNRMTFNRIITVNGVPGQMIGRDFEPFTVEELQALKYGLCSLMDMMMKLEKAERQALAGNSDAGNVKSRSSGGESISYESRKTVYDEALTDENKKSDLFRNALLEYIQPCAFRHNPFYAGSR